MSFQLKKWFLGAIFLSAILGLAGCGSDGSDGKDGQDADPSITDDLQSQIDDISQADLLKDVRPEQCVLCHDDSGSLAKSGAQHQADYEEFYQDQALRVINLVYSNVGGEDIVTFDMFKKDDLGVYQPFDCRLATSNPEPDVSDALSINWVQYDPATRSFSDGAASTFWRSIKGTLSYFGNGQCESRKAQSPLGDLSGLNGHIAVYGRDETLTADPAKHISSPKFPFAAMIKTGPGTDYVSVGNASGCENCHTQPFLKHTYIYGEVSENITDLADPGNDSNDFYVCKTCHLDARNGGHEDWQILADDPERHAEIIGDGPPITPEEEAKYAYKTRLMNDVHMSHAMEFGFPQSMRNCVTCHGDYRGDDPTKDKLDETLHADNFLPATCISCHAIDGLVGKMKGTAAAPITVHNQFADPDGDGVITAAEADLLKAKKCYACHSPANYVGPDGTDYGPGGTGTAGAGPEFISIHTGYDPKIYTDDGIKYSKAITVSIDSASFDTATSMLTIEFSASEDIAVDPYQPEDIEPTVFVGPYGYDTKHYIVGPHDRDADRNRLLEYVMDGSDHPRFTDISDPAAPGTWAVTVDMSMWADMIADGAIRRLEIGVMPALEHESITELDRRGNLVPMLVAMNAPSRTFDITVLPNGTFLNEYPDVADGVEDDVVDVLNGCNTCHDALATTFHSAQRGGNIKICKMCHVPSAAGSHLEMQSRSIDSYVHAIHSFQVFDIGDIDISDPVEEAEHFHHLSAEFPRFGVKNCESCHLEGKYGVPNQAQSLPSVHAGNDDAQFERNIGDVPPYVMGPASRACGACHRAQALNADDFDKLNAFNDHVRKFGYLVENDDGVWEAVVDKIMSIFN